MKPIIDPISMDILRYLHEHGNSRCLNMINALRHSDVVVYKRLREFKDMGIVTRTVDSDRSVFYWHTGLGISLYNLLKQAEDLMYESSKN